jgi:hypothetical protein
MLLAKRTQMRVVASDLCKSSGSGMHTQMGRAGRTLVHAVATIS